MSEQTRQLAAEWRWKCHARVETRATTIINMYEIGYLCCSSADVSSQIECYEKQNRLLALTHCTYTMGSTSLPYEFIGILFFSQLRYLL